MLVTVAVCLGIAGVVVILASIAKETSERIDRDIEQALRGKPLREAVDQVGLEISVCVDHSFKAIALENDGQFDELIVIALNCPRCTVTDQEVAS